MIAVGYMDDMLIVMERDSVDAMHECVNAALYGREQHLRPGTLPSGGQDPGKSVYEALQDSGFPYTPRRDGRQA